MTDQVKTDGPPVKDGFLYKKSKSFWKSTWREKYFILNGGSLYYYEKHTDSAAQGVIQLQNCKLTSESTEKRKNVITLLSIDKTYLLSSKSDKDYEEWLAAITANMSLPATPPPDKIGKLKKSKVSSHIVETAANFGASRKMIKEFVTDDTVTIMNALKSFVSQNDSPETADQLEAVAVQLVLKIGLLFKEKRVTKVYFLSLIEPLHKLCDRIIDGYEIPFSFSATELIESFEQVKLILDQLLKPHLNEKTMKSLHELLAYFENEELLNELFEKKKWKECGEIGMTLRHLWDNGMI